MQIPLTQGKTAIVDDSDYPFLSQFKWQAMFNRGRWYARAWIGGRRVTMHRALIQANARQPIDHKNGNGLDNRRSNLRLCTPAQNAMNRRPQKHSSRYKGVRWHSDYSKWVARIKVNQKLIHIGCFQTEEEAAEAYNREAVKLFGEFAMLNKIEREVSCP